MQKNKDVSINKPHITYRIQFHKDFNFADFKKIIPYLRELGIDTIYAAPILQSTPGSMHGYDGVNMNLINSELGTLEELRAIKKQLSKYKIKWLQDIVPNHMAFHPANKWLMNLLEFGESSKYRSFFDTCYSSNLFEKGKLMVPILGSTFEEAIANRDINVIFLDNFFQLSYQENHYPLSPESYFFILEDYLKETQPDFNGLLVQVNTAQANGDIEGWEQLRTHIFINLSDEKLKHILDQFNKDQKRVEELVAHQNYELCPWWFTNEKINFRRFFTVNELICLNVQDKNVFEQSHQLVKELVKEGLIDGLRIDHIDGLYNPNNYLYNLRKAVGPKTYIVAEKILERGEKLPAEWPIQGTTGYDFLSACNNVCSDRAGKKVLDTYYTKITGEKLSIKKEQCIKKSRILSVYMQGELDNLTQLLTSLIGVNSQDKRDSIRDILKSFIALFPVYRLYDDSFPLSTSSFELLSSLFEKLNKKPKLNREVLARVRDFFEEAQVNPESTNQTALTDFFLRCMQLTGPVMAKGVEDTLMYTYNSFIGHNEVGDHPANWGLKKKKFHKLMQERQRDWPLSINASSTHDTKRGEDSRSRLLVLTAMAQKWIKQVQIWQDIVWNEYRKDLPHPNDEYFIYQSLVASYPMGKQDAQDNAEFEKRFLDYLVKYLREGKARSTWENPDLVYETSVQEFASFLLDRDRPFFTSFYQFIGTVADFGILNSLTLQILKFTCPGVPDIYQGSELWNHSFVDPDNRRPIDYELIKNLLHTINNLPRAERIGYLWRNRYDGSIKLWLVKELIKLRRDDNALSSDSSYIPLKVSGRYRKHILAFARRSGEKWLVVVLPLHLAAIGKISKFVYGSFDWSDTKVHLSTNHTVNWQHIFSDVEGDGTEIPVNAIFGDLPLAILKYEARLPKRSSGILMHISSLPSSCGIGDLGPEARRFVRNLHHSGQSWWQVLPLGPTDESQCHSPYSTLSSRAGNPLFIDLQDLLNVGLLEKNELRALKRKDAQTLDFAEITRSKYKLLERAFDRLPAQLLFEFSEFAIKESSWLNDYALFKVLKNKHRNLPWYEWPPVYKHRNNAALNDFTTEFKQELQKEKWFQYLFFRQWNALRKYARDYGVRFIGDIPFYVAYDSADVWVNPQYFSLGADAEMKYVAGVPPDYFNADGQLWGMPTYNWASLKQDGYQWWIDRLSHNCSLFDKLRLDHFRAFSSYWEVPIEETSAKNGKWSSGPGEDFFEQVSMNLDNMPFIAEDLGDIDAKVYQLRDQFNFPGMAVLQFAFGNDMSSSPHIPHQYKHNLVAYTGTHDNNTTLSWYNQDLDLWSIENLHNYFGQMLESGNINETLMRSLYSSVADTVIVPMQDILNLDGSCRMNRPASTGGNWLWRMRRGAFSSKIQEKLIDYTKLYNR